MLKVHGVGAEVQIAGWKEYNKRIRLLYSLRFIDDGLLV